MVHGMKLEDALCDASSSSVDVGPLEESPAAAEQGTPVAKADDEEACEATVDEVTATSVKKQRLSTEPEAEALEEAAIEKEDIEEVAAAPVIAESAVAAATEGENEQEEAEDQYLKEFEAAAEQVRVRRASMATPVAAAAAASFDWFANNAEEDEVETTEAVETAIEED